MSESSSSSNNLVYSEDSKLAAGIISAILGLFGFLFLIIILKYTRKKKATHICAPAVLYNFFATKLIECLYFMFIGIGSIFISSLGTHQIYLTVQRVFLSIEIFFWFSGNLLSVLIIYDAYISMRSPLLARKNKVKMFICYLSAGCFIPLMLAIDHSYFSHFNMTCFYMNKGLVTLACVLLGIYLCVCFWLLIKLRQQMLNQQRLQLGLNSSVAQVLRIQYFFIGIFASLSIVIISLYTLGESPSTLIIHTIGFSSGPFLISLPFLYNITQISDNYSISDQNVTVRYQMRKELLTLVLKGIHHVFSRRSTLYEHNQSNEGFPDLFRLTSNSRSSLYTTKAARYSGKQEPLLGKEKEEDYLDCVIDGKNKGKNCKEKEKMELEELEKTTMINMQENFNFENWIGGGRGIIMDSKGGEEGIKMEFVEVAPLIFERIRMHFGLRNSIIANSFNLNKHKEGKINIFMQPREDTKFVIASTINYHFKSISKTEYEEIKNHLFEIRNHFCKCKDTMLMPLLGAYMLKLPRSFHLEPIYFILTKCIIPKCANYVKFEIKPNKHLMELKNSKYPILNWKEINHKRIQRALQSAGSSSNQKVEFSGLGISRTQERILKERLEADFTLLRDLNIAQYSMGFITELKELTPIVGENVKDYLNNFSYFANLDLKNKLFIYIYNNRLILKEIYPTYAMEYHISDVEERAILEGKFGSLLVEEEEELEDYDNTDNSIDYLELHGLNSKIEINSSLSVRGGSIVDWSSDDLDSTTQATSNKSTSQTDKSIAGNLTSTGDYLGEEETMFINFPHARLKNLDKEIYLSGTYMDDEEYKEEGEDIGIQLSETRPRMNTKKKLYSVCPFKLTCKICQSEINHYLYCYFTHTESQVHTYIS